MKRHPIFDENSGSYRLELTNGKFTTFDISDAHLVWNDWQYSPKGYAHSRKYGFMHNAIMGKMPGLCVDHINGDRLDNRRSNLRRCTPQQNHMNMLKKPGKKYKGVYPHEGKYQACIKVNGKTKYLGTFEDEADAASAYDSAATKLYGEFARLNF